ncbi:MAG: adenylosuccinate synthetase [Candidatus Bipolaricaulota bacterium]|nr:adenylosuccinate synthetase [Candidatus Bipolaricaulota bacterium]
MVGVGAESDSELPAQEFKFHLVPSGALHENCIGVLGNGMVVDPYALVQELNALRELRGSDPNIYISYGAHLLLPYHPIIERLEGSQSALDTTAGGDRPGLSRQGRTDRPENVRSALPPNVLGEA